MSSRRRETSDCGRRPFFGSFHHGRSQITHLFTRLALAGHRRRHRRIEIRSGARFVRKLSQFDTRAIMGRRAEGRWMTAYADVPDL